MPQGQYPKYVAHKYFTSKVIVCCQKLLALWNILQILHLNRKEANWERTMHPRLLFQSVVDLAAVQMISVEYEFVMIIHY